MPLISKKYCMTSFFWKVEKKKKKLVLLQDFVEILCLK